jgi:PEP-CTERM motif
MRSSSKLLVISLPLLLILSGAALADTCNSFSTYTCAKGVHDGAFIGGAGTAIASPGAGLLLSGNTFTVSTHNGTGGADVIILAASANGTPTGTLDGIAFNSLKTFAEGGATGAIVTNLQTAGFCGSTCNLSFAYVDLGKALPANGSITVTASGVGAGTALYAEVLNSKGQISFITANSESGVTGRGTGVVPEPGSLMLMGTGLLGLAAQVRRKLLG